MEMSEKNCGNCRFWGLRPDGWSDYQNGKWHDSGYRRNCRFVLWRMTEGSPAETYCFRNYEQNVTQ